MGYQGIGCLERSVREKRRKYFSVAAQFERPEI